MVINNKTYASSKFTQSINHNTIKKANIVKHLCVQLDEKLSCVSHLDAICKKLSKTCGIIYKLKH